MDALSVCLPSAARNVALFPIELVHFAYEVQMNAMCDFSCPHNKLESVSSDSVPRLPQHLSKDPVPQLKYSVLQNHRWRTMVLCGKSTPTKGSLLRKCVFSQFLRHKLLAVSAEKKVTKQREKKRLTSFGVYMYRGNAHVCGGRGS